MANSLAINPHKLFLTELWHLAMAMAGQTDQPRLLNPTLRTRRRRQTSPRASSAAGPGLGFNPALACFSFDQGLNGRWRRSVLHVTVAL